MPKQISQDELDSTLSAIARYPRGASISEIAEETHSPYTRRTLQRRLALLAEQKRLIIKGKGAATYYQMPPERELKVMGKDVPYIPTNLRLSEEATAIQQVIRQPFEDRKSVGYNRDFLDAYVPNKTWYLPLETRTYLHSLNRWREKDMPPGSYARKMYSRLMIDLSWNSSRLEGNTYSLLETDRLLNLGKSAEGKDVQEAIMLLNHKAAIEFLVEDAAEIGFNRHTILALHALLAQELIPDKKAVGSVRTRAVGIGSSVYEPLNVPQLLDECFRQVIDTAALIEDPFEQAFFAMVHLPYLQPFEDVNKRTSRFAANIPLIKKNYCPLTYVNLPKQMYADGILAVYELNRIEILRDVFVFAYGNSCRHYSTVAQEIGEPNFIAVQYRLFIKAAVANVVRDRLDKEAAARFIRKRAKLEVPEFDQQRVTELIERDLLSLHEGVIMVFRIRQHEFEAWQRVWE